MVLTIASVNVNGIRAAHRKGMPDWLAAEPLDVVTMQEVRCPDNLVAQHVEGYHVVHAESVQKGRAGVAIASKLAPTAHRIGFGEGDRFADQGRWIEADFDTADGRGLTVISAYVHTGDETNADKMRDKFDFMEAMIARIGALRDAGRHVVLTGDLNVAHREVDIKNWKGNVKKAGFLPEERAVFDRIFGELDWVDVGRKHGGEGPGPYSWWSQRGQAYDNDSGWRIDYQIASQDLAATSQFARVDRAPSYDTRWSDHAPVVVAYDL
ncbi:exodeoxyribonuclease III [Micrococcales bacterium 31B]|nr:exodeoxyribonuclease III [Micrococcales bacterium 31B]